jgi:hypothetical protein
MKNTSLIDESDLHEWRGEEEGLWTFLVFEGMSEMNKNEFRSRYVVKNPNKPTTRLPYERS